MIQPTRARNNIPFLTSDQKAEQLSRYLDSNEPRLLVPQAYLNNST